MRSHKAVSDSAPSRCLHRPQANAATRAGAMREDACSTRVEPTGSGKWIAWRPMMTWQQHRASTDQPSGMRSYVRRGTDSRPRQKVRPRADARTVPPCCSRATRASLCLAQRNPPKRRAVPLARPPPELETAPKLTQRAAPEPTADASPKSPTNQSNKKPNHQEGKSPQQSKTKSPPVRGRARVKTCHSKRPTCHSERSRGIQSPH